MLLIRRSILTEKIARRGRHIVQEYSVDPLALFQAEQIMTRDPATLKGDMRVGDALDFFQTRADHRSYPVVDEEGRLIGLVSRTDALRWQAGETPLSATLSETVSDAGLPFAHPDTPIGAIADLIVESGFGRIPIVEPAFRRVVGILSRQDLLKARKFHRIAEERRN